MAKPLAGFNSPKAKEQRAEQDRRTENGRASQYSASREYGRQDDMRRLGYAPAVDPDSLPIETGR